MLQQNTTTAETTANETTSPDIEVQVANDVSFNFHRPAADGLGLSIEFALDRAAGQDGTQLLIEARPLWKYEDGEIRADEWAEATFLAELTLDEARLLRAFLNHPEVQAILDGPRMAYGPAVNV